MNQGLDQTEQIFPRQSRSIAGVSDVQPETCKKNLSLGKMINQNGVLIVIQPCATFNLPLRAGALPALHFGGNFHEISLGDVIMLIQPWYKFFTNGLR